MKKLKIPKTVKPIQVRGRNGFFELMEIDVEVQGDIGRVSLHSKTRSVTWPPVLIAGEREAIAEMLREASEILDPKEEREDGSGF